MGAFALSPNGVPDVRIRLSGVSGTIANILVTGLDGIWQMPFNGANWLVAAVPTADASVVDVLFDYFKPITSYTVRVIYADGTSQTVSTNASVSQSQTASSSVSQPATYSLTATPASIQPGETVTVSWTGPAGGAKDRSDGSRAAIRTKTTTETVGAIPTARPQVHTRSLRQLRQARTNCAISRTTAIRTQLGAVQ